MTKPSGEASRRSVEHQPSETAMATATLRAMAAHDEREEIRGSDTLDAIRPISCAGSSICFDYASLSTEALSEEGAKKLREHMKSEFSAEPTQFGIPQGKIEAFLAKHGYVVVEHLTHSEMETRYLTVPDGSTVGKVPALSCLLHSALTGKGPVR
jgi:O-methyltransferase involved in polyketide biosynthesis